MSTDKQDLEVMLERAKAEFQGEAVLYAAERKPDRAKYRKRPSLLDEAFAKVIEDAEKDRSRGTDDRSR